MSAAVGTRIEKINLRMECSYVTGNEQITTSEERPPSYVNFLTACLPSRRLNVNPDFGLEGAWLPDSRSRMPK